MRLLARSLVLAFVGVVGCAPPLAPAAAPTRSITSATQRSTAIDVAVRDALKRGLSIGDIQAERYGDLWLVSLGGDARPLAVYVVSPGNGSVRSVLFQPPAVPPLHAGGMQ